MKKVRSTLLQAAREYHEAGFSVIPIGLNKKPQLPSWRKFKQEQPSDKQIEDWFSKSTVKGIGLITGERHWFNHW